MNTNKFQMLKQEGKKKMIFDYNKNISDFKKKWNNKEMLKKDKEKKK